MSKHGCTIIIDTNQFYSDLMLSGLRWKQLKSYLEKASDATIQMPQIVWKEIGRNYAKTVNSYLTNVESNLEKLNHHVRFSAPKLNYQPCEFALTSAPVHYTALRKKSTTDLVNAYLSFLKNKLGLKAKDFIETDKAWFNDIVERSIQHEKPFSEESDKGFKDTLLWKSVLSLKNKPGFKDHPIILISSNTRDFGSFSEKGKLHKSLIQEALENKLDLHYFENLDSFLQNWAGEIITKNSKEIENTISEMMIKKALQKHLIPWMKNSEAVEPNLFFTGVNYKIESVELKKQIIRVSVSGYITNTKTNFPYLDFNAEGTYNESLKEEIFKVENLFIPAEALIRRQLAEEALSVIGF